MKNNLNNTTFKTVGGKWLLYCAPGRYLNGYHIVTDGKYDATGDNSERYLPYVYNSPTGNESVTEIKVQSGYTQPPSISVNKNYKHIDVSFGWQDEDQLKYKMVIKPQTGYKFTGKVTLEVNINYNNYVVGETDTQELVIIYDNNNVGSQPVSILGSTRYSNEFVFHGAVDKIDEQPSVTDITATYHLNGCTINPTEKSYKSDKSVAFTLTPNVNTEFNTSPYAVVTDKLGHETRFTAVGNVINVDFSGITNPMYLDVYAETTPVIQPETGRGGINAYIVTPENLAAFANVRFFNVSGSDITLLDMGAYVSKIHTLFVTAKPLADVNVKCGNYDTAITAKSLEDDIVATDFGAVTIPYISESADDFSDALRLYLPFVGMVDIDSHLIAKTLDLSLKTDVITGDGLYVLTANGIVVGTWTCTPSDAYLYRSGNDYQAGTIGNNTWNANRLYDLNPYIVRTHSDSLSHARNKTSDAVTIGDTHGYNKFDNVTWADGCKIRPNHFEAVETLLSDGVFL